MTLHPIVPITISENIQAISFINDENFIYIGDSIVKVTNILENFYHTLGKVKVEILKSQNKIIYTVINQYTKLTFNYYTQQLTQILLSNVDKLILKYSNNYFSDPRQLLAPTLKEINDCFGATKPGYVEGKEYILNYNDKICFGFLNKNPESSSQIKIHNNLICSSLKLNRSIDKKSKFNKFLTCASNPEPILNLLQISQDKNENYIFNFNFLILLSGKNFADFDTGFESEESEGAQEIVRYSTGNRNFIDKSGNLQTICLQIKFGDSCQSLISKIGGPDEVYFKSENGHKKIRGECVGTDFYFNYFKYGLDILFSGQTKTIKKVILHTANPEHEDFAKRYSPCNFKLDNDTNILTNVNCNFDTIKNRINFGGDISTSDHLMLLSRNNNVEKCNALNELINITGAMLSSGFLYHNKYKKEIYEFTSSGELGIATFYS